MGSEFLRILLLSGDSANNMGTRMPPRCPVPRANGFAPPTAFDVTTALRAVCVDMTQKIADLRHIEMERVAISYCQTRRGSLHGTLAKLTPLRFEQGSLTTVRDGRPWTIQRLHVGRQEMRYILSVYLPRFFDLPFEEKLNTLIHELYHIGPQFDGDLRRFEGRCYAHSSSHQAYDEIIAMLVQDYLRKRSPRSRLLAFLQHDFTALKQTHQTIIGTRIPIPKLLPLPDQRAA